MKMVIMQQKELEIKFEKSKEKEIAEKIIQNLISYRKLLLQELK